MHILGEIGIIYQLVRLEVQLYQLRGANRPSGELFLVQ